MVEHRARGSFEITMTPGEGVIEGTGRFDFVKTWTGDLVAEGTGAMFSAGNPAAGAAGYVAIETVRGTLAGREGGFALLQRGLMRPDGVTLEYSVAPGSGMGDLVGITGALALDTSNGHTWELTYQLPD
ncbi:MAG: DUF3224 domain-containing protein [Propionibacteriaceae bacterium]|nr:DUF3224 domain-containing protein [Micropruina sp.]HBY24223.1 DUF3224 domain-containing protein [Propionibacteriaceae bacterium]